MNVTSALPTLQHVDLFIGGLICVMLLVALVARIRPTSKVSYLSLALRLSALLLVITALANPLVDEIPDSSSALIAIDLSESMNPGLLSEEASKIIQQLEASGWKYQILPFATKTGELSSSLKEAQKQSPDVGSSATSLEELTSTLLSSTIQDIILLSDGIETVGSLEDLLPQLKESYLRIYPHVPDALLKDQERISLEKLILPIRRDPGERVRGTFTARSSKRIETSGHVYVFMNDELLYDKSIQVPAHGHYAGDIELPAGSQEKDKIEVRFVSNEDNETKSRFWFIHAEKGEKILLLGEERQNTYLEEALKEENLIVETSLNQDKEDSNALAEFSSIILNNIPYNRLPSLIKNEMRKYVEQGGRLVMIGGERAYGLGGYVDTEIDLLLPLQSLPQRKELKRLNVAVQLVLDKSGSMKFGDRMESTKQAAREVARNLKDSDYLGVIGYDTTPFVAFPLRRMAEFRGMAIQRIGTLFPTGRTNLFPALDEARRALINVPAGRKHIIVMTDGALPDEGPHYLQLIQQMRLHGITVSTVMLGTDSDSRFIRSLAQYGSGSFYQTREASALPKIFMSDVEVSTKEETMPEGTEFDVRRSSVSERKLSSLVTFPPLLGFVETRPRKEEYVELVITAKGKPQPLLASRSIGRGLTIAYTSDAQGRWSAPWIRWEGFRQFWREVVQRKELEDTKGSAEGDFDIRVIRKGGEQILDIISFTEVTGEVRVNLQGEQDSLQSFNPRMVSPGRFQLPIPKTFSSAELEVSGALGRHTIPPLTLNLQDERLDEQSAVGVQLSLLQMLARDTGGTLNGYPTDSRQHPRSGTKGDSIAPLLLMLAFLLLLGDLVARVGRGSGFGRMRLFRQTK